MKPKPSWWILAAVFVAIVMVGALVSTRPTSSASPDGDAEPAAWTFMVYMIGDTNLEPYALDDIAEMASVGSTGDVNIVALVDRSPDYTTDPAVDVADWEDTLAFEVQQDHLEIIGEPGELNMGDPDTLADFVADTAAAYPADRYGLVLWDHGAGWPGVGPDETDGYDVLELAEIDQALSDGLGRAGIEDLDFMGFDACLMGTYEVASVMAEHAEYLVASQEVEPGHGWNYDALATITDDPAAGPTDLGSAVLEGYAEQAQEWGTDADITLAMMDLAEVAGLQDAVTALADAYQADPTGLGPGMATAHADVLEFGRSPDPELATNQIDLGGYVENLARAGDADVAAAAAEVSAALESLVLDQTAGPATAAASGVSIYFPEVEEYLEQDYLALAGVPAWPAALTAFFSSGDQLSEELRARFESGENTTDVVFDGDGVTLTAALPQAAAAAIIEATVSAAYRDGDDIVYLAEVPAAVTIGDDAATVSGWYDLSYLMLSDGDHEVLAHQDITTDPDSGYRTIDVPLEYVAPDADDDEYQDALLSIVVDDDGTIVEEDFYLLDDESGTYGAMTPDADALIYPVVLVYDDEDGWQYERTDDEGIAADLSAIQFAIDYLEAGTTLVLDADIQDYGQQTDTVSVEVVVP
ncbi:clostripain-related cysteine peptidase [Microbacterium cremeum]|uniref:clostripain-related cysteine peptidase n=1 Tax=Microbacterium cremeum TaxID=2782169 RepID=UPI001887624B|nr:clostripain-related cysteine peptidase [Microbacterium cremeum]